MAQEPAGEAQDAAGPAEAEGAGAGGLGARCTGGALVVGAVQAGIVVGRGFVVPADHESLTLKGSAAEKGSEAAGPPP